MASLRWYWHRLRAMGPSEVWGHARKKFHQTQDRRGFAEPVVDWTQGVAEGCFPPLPEKAKVPASLRSALQRDADAILAGEWKAFGHLPLRVDDPPRWHRDYLVGVDLSSARPGFDLDHRAQPNGADIKILWEPSRWNQLVRLALAAWLVDHRKAGEACVRWLGDWARSNPPFCGLNWTSALETGMRLIQCAWIDAGLLAADATSAAAHTRSWASSRRKLLDEILPAHVHYTWRYRSFGSSANNHLLGELAGLVVAIARWPGLARWAAPLDLLQREYEREVLRQFAEDGGNREQALGYHLFSWEFCWQTLGALVASGRTVSPAVIERLAAAEEFFAAMKVGDDGWDFGDSDNAWVTPLFEDEARVAEEWKQWFTDPSESPSLDYWWGGLRAKVGRKKALARADASRPSEPVWREFAASGYVAASSGPWRLRWDLSPLGYLATAAHGHLDLLHLSLWLDGVPLIIDPGTGAYYADREVRDFLAGWEAHNGPHPAGFGEPQRRGTFLWGEPQHDRAVLTAGPDGRRLAEATVAGVHLRRALLPLPGGRGWRVDDLCRQAAAGVKEVRVNWCFAPGVAIARLASQRFLLKVRQHRVVLTLGEGWHDAELQLPPEASGKTHAYRRADLGEADLQGLCSPAFRRLAAAPRLVLTGSVDRELATEFALDLGASGGRI